MVKHDLGIPQISLGISRVVLLCPVQAVDLYNPGILAHRVHLSGQDGAIHLYFVLPQYLFRGPPVIRAGFYSRLGFFKFMLKLHPVGVPLVHVMIDIAVIIQAE
ncbi:MAG: hypothetical protein LBK27_05535 [Treponema sp.]|nr:hypothetical protein [Treponema sp.]